MHPAPAGQGSPVLQYHQPAFPSPAAHGQPPTDDPPTFGPETVKPSDLPTPSLTPLPEIVARSIPSLHCSTGTAARLDFPDDVTIHLAFFEWNSADSTNVLEAFRHLPEECMGSIGMKLLQNLPPHTARVGDTTLSFDHTIFRDPAGFPVHAFKSVWVSGASSLIGPDFRGGGEQWRQIHWLAALHRFRPAHARVTQGAVHGIANPEIAWEAFESAILPGLEMKNPRPR